jgi:hypothetical protein
MYNINLCFQFLLIICTSFFMVGCNYAPNIKNDLDNLNLQGNVKSLKEISYKAVDKFGEYEKGTRSRSDKTETDKYIIFNQFGYIIEDYILNHDSLLIRSRLIQYDSTNRVTEENIYNDEGYLVSKGIYTYENHNVLSKSYYNPDGSLKLKILLSYNVDNRISSEKWVLKDGSTFKDYSYYYNDNECTIYSRNSKSENDYKIELRFNENFIVTFKKLYFYSPANREYFEVVSSNYSLDENENIISINKHLNKIWSRKLNDWATIDYVATNFFYGNDEYPTFYYYEYNPNPYGRNNKKWFKSDAVRVFFEDSDNYHRKYDYEFDEVGNWIQRIELKNEVPLFIVERTIVYY